MMISVETFLHCDYQNKTQNCAIKYYISIEELTSIQWMWLWRVRMIRYSINKCRWLSQARWASRTQLGRTWSPRCWCLPGRNRGISWRRRALPNTWGCCLRKSRWPHTSPCSRDRTHGASDFWVHDQGFCHKQLSDLHSRLSRTWTTFRIA